MAGGTRTEVKVLECERRFESERPVQKSGSLVLSDNMSLFIPVESQAPPNGHITRLSVVHKNQSERNRWP
jgi:hypothetical protein